MNEPTRMYSGYYHMHSTVNTEWCSRKLVPFQSGNRKADVVVMIALHPQGLVVVNQQRPVIGESIYEFPAGKIDAGETAIDAARRELYEETGLTFFDDVKFVPLCFPSVGLTDESSVVVTGQCYGKLSTDNLGEGEIIEPLIMDEQLQMWLLTSGKCLDTKLATYLIAKHHWEYA